MLETLQFRTAADICCSEFQTEGPCPDVERESLIKRGLSVSDVFDSATRMDNAGRRIGQWHRFGRTFRGFEASPLRARQFLARIRDPEPRLDSDCFEAEALTSKYEHA